MSARRPPRLPPPPAADVAARAAPRQLVLTALALLTCTASVAGFAGARHWALDLLSHFRPHYALLLTGLVLLCWWRRGGRLVGCACAGCLALQVAMLLQFWLPVDRIESVVAMGSGSRGAGGGAAAGPAGLRVLLANVHTSNRRFSAVADLIAREAADVVVLQETDRGWLDNLAEVQRAFPHRIEEARSDNFGIAVWSRLPAANARIVYLGRAGVPSVVVDIERGAHRLVLIATHPLPPVGAARSALRNEGLVQLARRAASAPGPVLVVGDLNCSPWSPHFRALLRDGRLLDSARGRGLQATWPAALGWFGIPIDHVLHGEGLAVLARRVGPDVGSDHRPLIVDLAWVGGR